jgi:hypothetical protein
MGRTNNNQKWGFSQNGDKFKAISLLKPASPYPL